MPTSIMSATTRVLSQPDDVRHLLRRLTFSAAPSAVRAVQGRSVGDAFDMLVRDAKAASPPSPPEFARRVWTNTALRYPDTTSEQYQALRAEQSKNNQREIEALRHWWLSEMIGGPAPLRENLALFLHGTLGSSSGSVDMPQALHDTNALLRRACFGTIPDLLEQLVVDPGAMIQTGMDEYRRERLAEKPANVRPAKLILDNWTVGTGQYSDADAMELARALLGWILVPPPGYEPARPVDPKAFRSQRRAGLVPALEREHSDPGPKTILGTTAAFDARSAVRFLALHPSTARRYSRRLIEYFGVADANQLLERQLVETYRRSDGSIEALLRDLVLSEQFWSPQSRWTLIKSPVHMAVGASRQLELPNPPLPVISRWLTATGQKLFDTPNFGDAGWPGQNAWVTPADRLAVRYQLGSVLAGRMPQLGIGLPSVEASAAVAPTRLVVGRALDAASTRILLMRLDPAPGVKPSDVDRHFANGPVYARIEQAVRHILSTPQYQVA